ncbi:hypothetical protein [Novosphingobium sp. M1R2S20]|uniref:Uncharacterized protein n=1 Tax=Novosphingobium rhizovicinum TaxID=3228928 RepID=A0ABV3RF01_9SPHN
MIAGDFILATEIAFPACDWESPKPRVAIKVLELGPFRSTQLASRTAVSAMSRKAKRVTGRATSESTVNSMRRNSTMSVMPG